MANGEVSIHDGQTSMEEEHGEVSTDDGEVGMEEVETLRWKNGGVRLENRERSTEEGDGEVSLETMTMIRMIMVRMMGFLGRVTQEAGDAADGEGGLLRELVQGDQARQVTKVIAELLHAVRHRDGLPLGVLQGLQLWQHVSQPVQDPLHRRFSLAACEG